MSTPEPVGTAFKDLCLDTSAAFWSSALGLVAQDRGDNALLSDGTAGSCTVAEALRGGDVMLYLARRP